MPPKSKTPDPVLPDETGTDEYATADEMATVLDSLAELSERVDRMERATSAAAGEGHRPDIRQAAAMRNDPVFRAQVGRGARRRQSEGDRQDEILRKNAERHMFEPAGDGVVTSAMTPGVPKPGFEPGEPGMEDASSPAFDSEGGMGQVDETADREPETGEPEIGNTITTDDTAALNR